MVIDALLDRWFDARCLEGFSNFLESKPPKYLSFLPLTYYTPKSIGIDYWPLGLLNLTLKLGIVVYLIINLVVSRTWAYSETPMSSVNAYGGGDFTPGSAYLAAAGAPMSNFSFCDNPQHAFMDSQIFNYSTPACEFVLADQLVVKGKGQVQVVTQFLENRYKGWPCASSVDASETAACASEGGAKYTQASGQCFCRTDKTIYPVGVENMTVSFEHTFDFPTGQYGLDTWQGTSTLTESLAGQNSDVTTAVKSEIRYPHGDASCFYGSGRRCKAFEPGTSVSLSVGEWLHATRPHSTSLEDLNTYTNTDVMGRDNGQRQPYLRMTGVVIEVLIRYDNGNPSITSQKKVSAHIEAQRKMLGWAGPGSQRIHVAYPTGSYGNQTFEYIDRYSQGVQFNFQPSGLVYKFNYNYLITTLAVAFVLLGVAGTITDVVAFFCLPDAHSKVLSSYRFQTVTKRQGFAELGMKTALASIDFTAFDPDNNKSIEAEDIVRVLAAVSLDDSDDPEVKMDAEKAHALALTILRDQVVSSEKPKSDAEKKASGPNEAFSFLDYMGTQDNGSIPFADFIKRIKMPQGGAMGDKKPSEEEVAKCKKAFEEGQRTAEGHMAEGLRQRSKKAGDTIDVPASNVKVTAKYDGLVSSTLTSLSEPSQPDPAAEQI